MMSGILRLFSCLVLGLMETDRSIIERLGGDATVSASDEEIVEGRSRSRRSLMRWARVHLLMAN